MKNFSFDKSKLYNVCIKKSDIKCVVPLDKFRCFLLSQKSIGSFYEDFDVIKIQYHKDRNQATLNFNTDECARLFSKALKEYQDIVQFKGYEPEARKEYIINSIIAYSDSTISDHTIRVNPQNQNMDAVPVVPPLEVPPQPTVSVDRIIKTSERPGLDSKSSLDNESSESDDSDNSSNVDKSINFDTNVEPPEQTQQIQHKEQSSNKHDSAVQSKSHNYSSVDEDDEDELSQTIMALKTRLADIDKELNGLTDEDYDDSNTDDTDNNDEVDSVDKADSNLFSTETDDISSEDEEKGDSVYAANNDIEDISSGNDSDNSDELSDTDDEFDESDESNDKVDQDENDNDESTENARDKSTKRQSSSLVDDDDDNISIDDFFSSEDNSNLDAEDSNDDISTEQPNDTNTNTDTDIIEDDNEDNENEGNNDENDKSNEGNDVVEDEVTSNDVEDSETDNDIDDENEDDESDEGNENEEDSTSDKSEDIEVDLDTDDKDSSNVNKSNTDSSNADNESDNKSSNKSNTDSSSNENLQTQRREKSSNSSNIFDKPRIRSKQPVTSRYATSMMNRRSPNKGMMGHKPLGRSLRNSLEFDTTDDIVNEITSVGGIASKIGSVDLIGSMATDFIDDDFDSPYNYPLGKLVRKVNKYYANLYDV